MKCEKCGKNEANYHYTSNINGKVSEKHLCSDCASEMGLDRQMHAYANQMFGSMFDGMLGDFFGGRRRYLSPWDGFDSFGFPMPAMVVPAFPFLLDSSESCPTCGVKTEEAKTQESKADPEMKKRREINMLREQMRAAAEQEDFEKAAKLRDQLRELEKTDK